MQLVSIDDLIKKLTDKHMELKEAVKEANKVQFKNQGTDCSTLSSRARKAWEEMQSALMVTEMISDDLKIVMKFKKTRDGVPCTPAVISTLQSSAIEALAELQENIQISHDHKHKFYSTYFNICALV